MKKIVISNEERRKCVIGVKIGNVFVVLVVVLVVVIFFGIVAVNGVVDIVSDGVGGISSSMIILPIKTA